MAQQNAHDISEAGVGVLNEGTNPADGDQQPGERRTSRAHRRGTRYVDVYLLTPDAEYCTWSMPGDGRAGAVELRRMRGSWPGYNGDSLTTLRLHDVLHPDDRDAVDAAWEQAAAARKPFSIECRVRLSGWGERRLAVHAIPLFDRRGGLRRWAGSCQDITGRNEREFGRSIALMHGHAARLSHDLATGLQRERAAQADMMQARDQLEALQALTDTALFHLQLEDLLAEVLDRVQDIMAVDSAAILLLAADGKTLQGRLAVGMEAADVTQVRIPVGEGLAGRIAATLQPLAVEDLASLPAKNPLLHQQLRSALGVPLLAEHRLLGVLHVGTVERRDFTEADVRLLQQAAERVALAIERAYAYEAAEQAREKAERQAEQLDRIFEQLGEGLSVYDAQGLLVRTNAAQRRLLGLDAAPHRYFQTPMRERMDLYRLRDRFGHPVAPEDWPVTRALRGEVVTGADALYLRLRSLDGRELEVLSSAAPLRDRDGHIVGAVGVVRDQTEQNLMQRDREAVQAREWAARELALQLDQFFTMAAHDIRSPLTSVLGGVQLAQRRVEQLKAGLEPDGKQADLVSRVVSSLAAAQVSVDRLIRLAELLFDVAKARSGRLEVHLAPCDLAAVVREQVQAQRVSAPHRDIRLEMPDQAVPVLGEADRLGQVLTNYMTNALKYSTDDQPVDVRLEVWERQVVVSVRDMGPGLALAEQARVWELFHRAPGVEVLSGAGGASSLGLGLYICKRLIELHGGRVGVESTVGQGSTFWFRLPLALGDPAVDETPQ